MVVLGQNWVLALVQEAELQDALYEVGMELLPIGSLVRARGPGDTRDSRQDTAGIVCIWLSVWAFFVYVCVHVS